MKENIEEKDFPSLEYVLAYTYNIECDEFWHNENENMKETKMGIKHNINQQPCKMT